MIPTPMCDKWSTCRDQCAAAGVPFLCKQVPVFKDGKWQVSSTLADFSPDLRIAQRPQGQKEGTK